MSTLRDRHLFVAGVSILLVSCNGFVSTPTSTSTSASLAGTSAPSTTLAEGNGPQYLLAREPRTEPPTVWAAVALLAQVDFLFLGSGDEISEVATVAAANSTTDVSLGESDVSVATCCEPAAGRVVVFNHVGRELLGDSGTQLDQFDDVMARIDSSAGSVLIWPEWPRSGGENISDIVLVPGVESDFVNGNRTIDIALFAIDPLGVAILRDLGGKFVLTKYWEGATVDTELPEGRWCHLIGLAGGQFALLADIDEDEYRCHSSEEVTVIDFEGRPTGSMIGLEGGAVHANSDESGTFIAYVTPEREIRWVSIDARSGSIDFSEQYLAVDW